MADQPSESKNVIPTTRRGGAMASPAHIFQLALATACLLASSYFLIIQSWLIGFVLLAVALPLCLINTQK